MHRLMSARNVNQLNLSSINNLQNTLVHKTAAVNEITCSFCRQVLLDSHTTENFILARHQSTNTASALRSLKKKGKHKAYKKYGELLEVSGANTTESKVSISKLHASHLSKLASSPISLGQLHQLTKPVKKTKSIEVDPELLETVKKKILKKSNPDSNLADDKCALVFTNHKISSLEYKLRTKHYLDSVKQSYYNFRKATLFDQRLTDLRYAINEGVTQELDFDAQSISGNDKTTLKSPHSVFRELFVENNSLNNYDHDLMNQITMLQLQGNPHPSLEDICDDVALHNDIVEHRDDYEPDDTFKHIKGLKLKKAQAELKQKRKKRLEKRRAAQEVNMKQDMHELERQGKEEALQRTLTAHLQLLCSLNMASEGHKVLKHYRQRCANARHLEHPCVRDVKIYNTLLHGYASVGKLDSVRELLSYMSEDGITMDAQTYAAVFECVERSDLIEKEAVLNIYHKQMMDKGIQLNDLLAKTKFLFDQREVVLKAVRRIEENFTPHYEPPPLDYNCPLLEKLKLDNIENRMGLATSPASGLLTLDEMKTLGKEQLELELKGEMDVRNIAVEENSSTTVKIYREKLSVAEKEWREVIRDAFVRNLSTLKSRSNASHSAITLYPYLKVLQIDEFVNLMMGEINKLVDGSESYSPTLKLLQRDLGSQVYNRYKIDQYKKNGVLQKIEQIYGKYCEWYLTRSSLDGTPRPYNSRQTWQLLLHQNREGASLDVEEMPWSMEMRQNIGKFLYNIIINDVKIDVNMFKPKAKVKKLPALYKVHRPWGRLVRLELKPHPTLTRLCAAAARPTLSMRACLAPTLSPPVPWRSPASAAYLLTETPLIRMPIFVMKQMKRLEEAPPQNLYPVLDSLNQLGEVPWVINQRILDLQLKVFRSGGDKKLDIPPPASSLDPSELFTGSDSEPANSFRRRLAFSRAKADMHSLWCDSLYKLSLANHYRDRVFWLPHNMDFRGRVYAVSPHVSVLGADAARSLLVLAQKRKLGARGLRWLKLHAVNLTGALKRQTIHERLEYAESIMEKILDSADNPLDGEGWWKESEEPWQTLACCVEIANAVRSPNPEEYECGFPVHQDGSCNGLQHYAALGGDAAGAAAVNLAPHRAPQDVYSEVAAMVEGMRVRDAAAGMKSAIILENFVRRKVIKQTVMTTVYGVTRFGARLQIAKQLKDIDAFPKEHVWPCSHYLTNKTFDSLREMFTSTKHIQDWFTECAKVISGVCGESVEWVTPLGLPVLQPYYRRAPPSTSPCSPPLDLKQRPCTMKQRNAFPPNFIHSLDSSHMMLTGLHCEAAAVTFVSVHDCFWTHPDTVDTMNQICREQFVALHSQPILEDLSDFMVKRYSYPEEELELGSVGASNKKRVNALLQKVPEKGQFDINSVLDSVYFFS
ncbi:DNA-directed RNA polymerase, mitochondrial [Leptidea sinapis]|uniref:DNA-directed RNA polymerase, mitochondrial n=1 Tax=Leptidea sinapis TaxID=189913 RepID=UPI002141DF91|nr:DNA-directed RNA polymerase, mitochondrial [Leptidea sinapis]